MLNESGDLLLIHDSGPDSVDLPTGRVITFASTELLRALSKSDMWFCDGNFAMAPEQVSQLYVVRSAIGGRTITCASCLLTRKTRDAYEYFTNLFEVAADAGIRLVPSNIMMDYELGAINGASVALRFGFASHACYYHFSQSLWPGMKRFGFQGVCK